MKEELRVFLTAVMFYTRIRVPSSVDHNAEFISKSTRYFPLVGWIVGLISTIALAIGYLLFGLLVALICSLIASVWITGAFHEDGFADVCDGFGGGWTKEMILEIMKDSRIGTFGTIGLILIIFLKFVLMYEFLENTNLGLWIVLFYLLSVQALSRFNASLLIPLMKYVQVTDFSKSKPVSTSFRGVSLIIAAVFGMTPMVLFCYLIGSWLFLLALLPLLLSMLMMRSFLKKWIGGYTGDCLGALQQISEVVILATVLGVWKFI